MIDESVSQKPIILDGKKTSQEIIAEIADEVTAMLNAGNRAPHLAAILVGEDGASRTYVKNKVRACENAGFRSSLIHYDADTSENQLLTKIAELNEDESVDGILVQLPLPDQISPAKVTAQIDPGKDVDGFTVENFGRIASQLPAYLPATPLGILELFKRYDIQTQGKHCVVVGYSRIVGAPMSMLLAGPWKATVTSCHIHTEDLAFHTRQADILIVATGQPGLIKDDMVREDAIVVDVGITRVEDPNSKRGYVLKGDVDFDAVSRKASYITPVPGGVGPMTIAALLINTLHAAKGTYS